MIVARPLNTSEPDLLLGCEFKSLKITDLDNSVVALFPAPIGGWTHDKLEAVDCDKYAPFGWEAFLDNDWIGSSEV